MVKLYAKKSFLGFDHILDELSNCPAEFTRIIFEKYGAHIGEKINFKGKIVVDNAYKDLSNLLIGNKCFIGKQVFFDLPEKIIIEDECVISAGVKIITHSDCGDRAMSKWYPRKNKEVKIGFGSWIGVDSIILSGVSLGKCCVVAAGSVVTESFPDYSVLAGIPAKIVKKLEA